MPRLVTVHRQDEVARQAQDYVRSSILFPSGLLGLVSMIGGVGGLGYQLMATDSYSWGTFYQSTGLIFLGAAMGIVQTRYHQFLFRRFPDVLAARMRTASASSSGKKKKDPLVPEIVHPGRAWVPVAYVCGSLALVGSSALATLVGHVSALAAFLMPWAGFYWARLFFWRRVVQ